MKEGLPIFQLKKLNEISKLIDIYLEENMKKLLNMHLMFIMKIFMKIFSKY